MTIELSEVYVQSDDVVAREIEGELIIVPLASGIGDMEDELFSLNETGQEVWARLDGVHALSAIVTGLAQVYDAPQTEIEQDVVGLMTELLKRKIVRLKD